MLTYSPVIQSIFICEGNPIDVLRLDAIHPIISGNKWFKLKYNLAEARRLNAIGIMTFGGAHSNHLAATAAACKEAGLQSIAFIRGELPSELSPTLQFILSQGMQLVSLPRSEYRLRNSPAQQAIWQRQYPNFYLVPEGGANAEGRQGAAEIWQGLSHYDYVCCACGTATTFAGLLSAVPDKTVLIGLSVLKGENTLRDEVANLFFEQEDRIPGGNEILEKTPIGRHVLINTFAFKGYASYEPEVFEFEKSILNTQNLLLDHVYTGKLLYGVKELLKSGHLPAKSRILVIHSGGIQGNTAFEQRYKLS